MSATKKPKLTVSDLVNNCFTSVSMKRLFTTAGCSRSTTAAKETMRGDATLFLVTVLRSAMIIASQRGSSTIRPSDIEKATMQCSNRIIVGMKPNKKRKTKRRDSAAAKSDNATDKTRKSSATDKGGKSSVTERGGYGRGKGGKALVGKDEVDDDDIGVEEYEFFGEDDVDASAFPDGDDEEEI